MWTPKALQTALQYIYFTNTFEFQMLSENSKKNFINI